MSELKAVHAFDVYEAYTKTGDDDAAQVYPKSEADKVLAELKQALWLKRAERYKMCEFIAREECNWHEHMAWSKYLRERTYNQWVDQLLRIANLANKLQNKCLAKVEEYK